MMFLGRRRDRSRVHSRLFQRFSTQNPTWIQHDFSSGGVVFWRGDLLRQKDTIGHLNASYVHDYVKKIQSVT